MDYLEWKSKTQFELRKLNCGLLRDWGPLTEFQGHKGHWVTIRGRKVFIREGESAKQAYERATGDKTPKDIKGKKPSDKTGKAEMVNRKTITQGEIGDLKAELKQKHGNIAGYYSSGRGWWYEDGTSFRLDISPRGEGEVEIKAPDGGIKTIKIKPVDWNAPLPGDEGEEEGGRLY